MTSIRKKIRAENNRNWNLQCRLKIRWPRSAAGTIGSRHRIAFSVNRCWKNHCRLLIYRVRLRAIGRRDRNSVSDESQLRGGPLATVGRSTWKISLGSARVAPVLSMPPIDLRPTVPSLCAKEEIIGKKKGKQKASRHEGVSLTLVPFCRMCVCVCVHFCR